MKREHDTHHAHANHASAGGTLAKVFMTPITVISAAVDTLKLMFPLMMITVPICYVFPWELITGGPGAAGSKLFRKNSVDRPSDPATRNMALWLSTFMNVILAFCFGAGGGGGGH
jgi:hypothetical protein